MSSPESVSSRIASFGSSTSICRISLRFFSPPEKPSLTPRDRNVSLICMNFIFSRIERQEIEGVDLRRGRPPCAGVQRRLQQVDVVDARDLDRILEAEEEPGARALLGRQRQQVAAVEATVPCVTT